MMVIPAVDMLDHNVVQLVGGVRGTELFRLPDPLQTARNWAAKGAPMLHLVDLDGAFGKGDNLQVMADIAMEVGLPVQAGGGMNQEKKIDFLLDAGVRRVIVGSRAVKEPEWLAQLSASRPGRIVLAMDVKDGMIAVKGWQEKAPLSIGGMFDIIRDMPLSAVLNTNVNVEGQGKGIDRVAAEEFIRLCPHPVIASGGVSSIDDVRFLTQLGAEGAVVGVSIYNGTLEPWKWQEPWKDDL
jgi:phosphoribosylformimino-5-aminoimidazole carboxamide ribotide isomerase